MAVNGAKIHYAQWGHGRPVILLHGGPANSDYLAHQVRDLKRDHRVIVIDTRGHGRSTTDGRPLGYDMFADDVVGVMNALHVRKADFLGWSDGGITALDVSMRYPERVKKVVAFGANTDTRGTFSDADRKPAFAAFLARAEAEYRALSSTPEGFAALGDQLGDMYSTQPNWTPAQLRTIKAPVLIMAGDHDEAIKPEHTRYMAHAIPGAELRVLPNTSHFAFLQDPAGFNGAVRAFLD